MGIFSRRNDTATAVATPAASGPAVPELGHLTGEYTIDQAHSRIGFAVRHAMVTNVRGEFTEYDGKLHLDGAAPANSSADLVIKVASVDTNQAQRDEHLRTGDPDIFAAGDCCSFPLALYGGRRVRLEAWRNAQEQGALAGRNMLGAGEAHEAVPWFWSDQYDLGLQIAGLPDEGVETVTLRLGFAGRGLEPEDEREGAVVLVAEVRHRLVARSEREPLDADAALELVGARGIDEPGQVGQQLVAVALRVLLVGVVDRVGQHAVEVRVPGEVEVPALRKRVELLAVDAAAQVPDRDALVASPGRHTATIGPESRAQHLSVVAFEGVS